MTLINAQKRKHVAFYIVFAVSGLIIMGYFLSNTILHFTTERQFPVNSLSRYPLTWIIFPAEVFSFLFALYFTYTLISDRYRPPRPRPLENKNQTKVAILLPVYNEPEDVMERTIRHCKELRWDGGVKIYLLDDSNNEADKKVVEKLGKKYGLVIVRREGNKGYKAGNINNAILHVVKEPFFAVFDSDQAPEPDFLEKTMDYFSDEKVGFVQTPQHFINDKTILERAIKLGTDIFYRAQSVARAKDGAIPYCGTNLVVRRAVFVAVGGFSYYTATEDIDLGIRINEEGYRGVYVPEILVKGYAPSDFKAYTSQQYRWANGNLAILREYWWRLLTGDFPLRYKIHVFFTVGWWLIGLVSIIYIIVPLLSVAFGSGTHHAWLPSSVLGFLFVYVGMGLTLITVSLRGRVHGEKIKLSDAFIQYSLIVNSFIIYARAAINALILKRYVGFVRTNKKKSATGFSQVKWNLILAALCLAGAFYSLYFAALATTGEQLRSNLPVSLWLLFYGVILSSSILFVGKHAEN